MASASASTQFKFPWRHPLTLVVVVLVLLGIFFRFLNLDQKVYWVDEVFTSLRVSGYGEAEVSQIWQQQPTTTAGELMEFQRVNPNKSVWDTVQGLATQEPQLPPLYFVLTRWWSGVFGDSVTITRSFGAVVSVLALPMMGLLCWELFQSWTTSLIAVGSLAISPFQIVYAQEARPYSLWVLMTLVVSWSLVRSLRRHTMSDWIGYGLSMAVSLYSFVYSLFVLLAHSLYVGLLRSTLGGERLQRFSLATAGALLLFLPWLVVIANYWQRGVELASWQRQPPARGWLALLMAWCQHLTRFFVDFEQNYNFSLNNLWPYFVVVLAVLALVGYSLYVLVTEAPKHVWLLVVLLLLVPALGVIGPDLLFQGQQSIATRYFVPASIAAVMSVAFLFSVRLDQSLWRFGLAALWAMGILSCGNYALSVSWWGKQGGYMPYVAAVINQTPNPMVLSDTDWWVLSLAHGLEPDTPIQLFDTTQTAPSIPAGYSHYFLYNASESVLVSLAEQGYQIAHFKELDQVPIWCLGTAEQPLMACPPVRN
jgi:uncharacterized membrane protein